jgi:mono/diheme cytochrome c family protein
MPPLSALKIPTRDMEIGQSESERGVEEKGQEMRLIRLECGVTMHVRTAALLFAFALAVLANFAGGVAIRARSTSQMPATDQRLMAEERARLLAKGKELFLARCSRCHGENRDKPLKSGVPLSERRLSTDEIASAVKGRLRDGSDEERRAVTLYISSLMKAKEPEGRAASKP